MRTGYLPTHPPKTLSTPGVCAPAETAHDRRTARSETARADRFARGRVFIF
jgi:hypothetical protein